MVGLFSFFRRSSIVLLRYPISPTAIFLAVVAIIVYPIQSKSFWARSHIFVKILKIVPFFAHRNAPSSIPFISLASRIFASSQHRKPNGVDWFKAHAMFEFYDSISLYGKLIPKTSAGACSAAFKRACSGYKFIPAIAMAKPSRSAIWRWPSSDYNKPTKSISGRNFWTIHSPILTFGAGS